MKTRTVHSITYLDINVDIVMHEEKTINSMEHFYWTFQQLEKHKVNLKMKHFIYS